MPIVQVRRVFAVLAVVGVAAGFGGADVAGQRPGTMPGSSEATDDSRVVIATSEDPDDLDPHAGGPTLIDNQVFESLYVYDANRELVPHLATDLPTMVDDVTWDISLQEGVTYHDGTPMDAAAVADSLNGLKGRAESGEAGEFDPVVESVEAVDDFTLRFHLTEPNPFLADMLAYVHVTKADNPDVAESPIGTGPYRFVEWMRGSSVTLERNEDYWGDAPAFGEVEFRILADKGTQVAALQGGEVDLVSELPAEDQDRVPHFVAVESGEIPYLVLNARDGITTDVRVRQALSLAIDLESIRDDLLLGLGSVLPCQPMRPGYVGFNDQLEAPSYDPDRARELIVEAGVEGADIEVLGVSGRWQKDREQVEAIAGFWSEIGLNATPRIIPFEQYAEEIQNQEPPTARPDAYFVSKPAEVPDGSNFAGYYIDGGRLASNSDAELTQMMTEANSMTDLDERSAAYADAFAYACEQAYFVNLVSPQLVWGYSDRLADPSATWLGDSGTLRVGDLEPAS